jgi:K+ transporter
VILVTVEYAWLAMSLGKKGEGGTICFKGITCPSAQVRKAGGICYTTFIYRYIPFCR